MFSVAKCPELAFLFVHAQMEQSAQDWRFCLFMLKYSLDRLYNYHYTVTARMTPALRWAAMRAIFTRQCPQTTTFEEKGGPKGIRTEVPVSYTHLTLPTKVNV